MNLIRRCLTALAALLALTVIPPTALTAGTGLPVPFLPTPPQIDGVLDASLAGLPAVPFGKVEATDSRGAIVPANYRLAYGATFLYLYIEVADGHPVHRDRSYQNGDGFHLVLAVPQPDGAPSREFYVLGFAGGNGGGDFLHQFVWYHDVDLAFTPLGEVVRFAQHSTEGKTGYELLLPWSEVPPYHPWVSPAIGFNLCFVKAVGTKDKVYHYIHADDLIQDEQSPRLSEPLEFQSPVLTEGQQTVLLPDRNNCRAGETVTATQVTLAAGAMKVPLNIRLRTGDGVAIDDESEFACQPGLNRRRLELPTGGLPSEGIRFQWSTRGAVVEGESPLSILPAVSPDEWRARLTAASHSLAPASHTTLEFRLAQIETQLAALKPWRPCGKLRLEIAEFARLLERAERGQDAIAERRGLLRRAFRSAVDGSLQPYSANVPGDLDRNQRYALLMILHGSGQEDVGLLDNLPLFPGTIMMAPRARGTSNWYVGDHAQEDIAEALADVMANYPIDPQRVILAGFSMGGYGVYRTFFETPGKFRGLMVLAGTPRLPGGAGYPTAVDFTLKKNLKKFRGVPIFIAHGTADLNCAFALTESLVGKLKECGARVEFLADPGAGHGVSPAMLRGSAAWLAKQLSSDAPQP